MPDDQIYSSLLETLREKQQHHLNEAVKLDTAIAAIMALTDGEAMTPVVVRHGAAKTASPVVPVPKTYDRAHARNYVARMRMNWPVPASYMLGSANFARQAACGAVQSHPRFGDWMTSMAITHLDNHHRTWEVLREACHFLGIDIEAVRQEAFTIYEGIKAHGVAGIDYLGKDVSHKLIRNGPGLLRGTNAWLKATTVLPEELDK